MVLSEALQGQVSAKPTQFRVGVYDLRFRGLALMWRG